MYSIRVDYFLTGSVETVFSVRKIILQIYMIYGTILVYCIALIEVLQYRIGEPFRGTCISSPITSPKESQQHSDRIIKEQPPDLFSHSNSTIMQRDHQQNNKNTDASAGTDQEQHQHRYQQHHLDASVLTEQQRRQSMLASSLPSWLAHSRGAGGGGGGHRRRNTSSRSATTPSQHHHHVVVTWKPEHFPFKMYDLLEEVTRQGLESIIAWSTGGTTFTIHNQSAFEQWIMPLYFSGMSSYKSFRRQLNLYGIYQHRHRPTQDANGTEFSLCVCCLLI